MKAHSQDFKDKIKLMGRQLDSKITYTIDDEEIELGKEELNSITPHYQGSLLKSVMKQLDIDSNVDIPLGTEVDYQLGLLNDDEYEYLDYGNYIVYSSEKQEDTRSYKIVCYDKMLYSMVDYKGLIGISFPMTIRDYIGHIANLMNIPFKNENDTFTNYDRILQTDPYVQINEDDGSIQPMDYTIRDVLDELSQVTASTICINADDELELRDINITDTNADFEIEGATTQETTTGKNWLNVDATFPQSIDGLTISRESDGKITINGTPTGRPSIFLTTQQNITLPAGTYTLSKPEHFFVYLIPGWKGGTFTLTEETTFRQAYIAVQSENVGVTYNESFYPMLVSGSTLGDYEPYTGEMPAPNPDYPMPVINKTGEIEEEINGELRKINLGSVELCGIGDYKDKLRRSTGKNLFDGEFKKLALWSTGAGANTTFAGSNNNYVGAYCKVEAGKTYSVSRLKETNRFTVSFSVDEPVENVATKVYNTGSGKKLESITIPTGYNYLFVYLSNSGETTDDIDLMINEGSTALPYEPYYPKGTWYKYSKIGKYKFDGTELWDGNVVGTGLQLNLSASKLSTLGIPELRKTDNNTLSIMSNMFKDDIFNNRGRVDNIIYSGNNDGYIRIYSTKFESYTDYKTYLTTHNLITYFQLANPTYEIITDTTAIRSLNDTGLDEIDEEYLKDVNVKFGEKYGPVNSLVLSRSANSDNIYRKDNESIVENGLCELRIADNLILNNNDRDEYIDAIFDKVKGLEYFVNDYSSTGVCYYDLLDRYDVKVEGNHYPCIMLNDEINVTQGLVEEIHADALEHSETDYTKADKTDRKINQTTLIVDKQNGIITAKVEALDKNYQDLNNNLYGENGDIAKLGTRIDQKVDSITFNTYKERIDNGDVVIDNTMVLINDEGINVSTDDSKISTQITNNAFEIKDSSGTELAFFGYDETENTSKSQFDNLNITRYLTAGNHRIEKCGNSLERTGWFYIGGSQ